MPVLPIYSATIFIGASLLFVVQPMFAKMVLPLLGGAPQVWAMCMVFFQATLLAGYAYVHWSTTLLGVRRQSLVHVGVLGLALLALPLAIDPAAVPPAAGSPEAWLLGQLAVTVGLPFFVVSTTAPLLQKWYAESGASGAHDPYFLYVASNIGSMIGLLGYPLVVEPLLGLERQGIAWSWGYAVLAVLVVVVSGMLRRASASPGEAPGSPPVDDGPVAGPVTTRRALHWIALAFVPSSLMLGLTTHVTTDIAAVPLLWVVPLALYLLTFTLVFARRALIPPGAAARALPILTVVLALLLVSNMTSPAWLVLSVNVLTFFAAALVCHGELAADRPHIDHLTAFYLLMSLGGVLGGVFNALLAPVIFDQVSEYPLALVLACALIPAREHARFGPGLRGVAMVAAPAMLVLVLPHLLEPLSDTLGIGGRGFDHLRTVAVIALPLIGCYAMSRSPVRFALALGAWFIAGDLVYERARGDLLIAERSFFGVHRVSYQPDYDAHMLRHGLTAHGMQKLDPRVRHIPTTYYHPTGPAGQVFIASEGHLRRVALVGLGAGTLAAYSVPGSEFTYFEIDPHVVGIAEDESYFTYLADARRAGASVDIRLGDARITIAGEPDAHYDMLLVDAFSSASIPMHLLTREALALYLTKLRPGGLLLFHVSNDYLDVAAALAELAADAGLAMLYQNNTVESDAERDQGKLASQWVVMARDDGDLATLEVRPGRWLPLEAKGSRPWTDDFSNIVRMLKGKNRREMISAAPESRNRTPVALAGRGRETG